MRDVIHGVIHGKTIELERDLGLADGQPVEVVVRPVATSENRGPGVETAAGMLADYPEMDEYMEEIQRWRKSSKFRETCGSRIG